MGSGPSCDIAYLESQATRSSYLSPSFLCKIEIITSILWDLGKN